VALVRGGAGGGHAGPGDAGGGAGPHREVGGGAAAPLPPGQAGGAEDHPHQQGQRGQRGRGVLEAHGCQLVFRSTSSDLSVVSLVRSTCGSRSTRR